MPTSPIAVVDDRRFDEHRSQQPHPERPERLIAARAALERTLPPEDRVDVNVRAVTDQEALRVHSHDYLVYLEHVLRRGSGYIDADTYFCEATEEAARLAAGGSVELSRMMLDGKALRGIALLRPPGHHATSSQAMGFCLLNNVAIAAADALAHGAKRVAIVDWDVHHGNGTQDIFYEDDRTLYVSLHESPLYPGTGAPREVGGRGAEGRNINIAMPSGTRPAAYGEAFRTIVLPALEAFDPDLVLVSAGFDAHYRDPLAGLELDARCFGAMTTALADLADRLGHGRLGLFLEGGYDLDAIEDCVAAVLRALGGERFEFVTDSLRPAEQRALQQTMQAHEATLPPS